ncbi:hypothetical protein IWX49DRAFT_551274 [Phyllosticta citricarpa]|uniref:Uncharacterized protein n=1 Tax=Phyllosticta citricarpa TaxID=55181 RepID=A0ABR1MCP3_9PEZI
MDVHSLLRIKDACAHYLSIFFATVLRQLAIFHHRLQEVIPSCDLQSIFTLIKINVLKPFVVAINHEFSPGTWLYPSKNITANALKFLSSSGHHLQNRVLVPAWPSLGTLCDAASEQVRSLATDVCVYLGNHLGRVLTYGRQYFDWLRNVTPITMVHHLVRFVKTASLKADLVKTSVVDESKSHLKRLSNVTLIERPLSVSVYLENATKTGISSYSKARDVFGHLSWACRIREVVPRFCGHAFSIVADCVPLLVSFVSGLLDTAAALIDSSETYLASLLTFCQTWISSCAKTIILGGLYPMANRPLHFALFALAGLLVLWIVMHLPWYRLAKSFHLKLRLHFPRTSRRQCRAELKKFALSTIRHTLCLLQTVAKISAVIFSALRYFVLTPVDTLILLGFVTAYVFMTSLRIIGRFSLLDQLSLDMKLRNNMPGAWVKSMDEEPCKGLFRSTLQLQPPRAPTTFSSLPRTIRSRIYELALTDHKGFKWDNRMKTLRSNLSPSLLRVSHNTRLSTLPIPFNMNKITIDTVPRAVQPSLPPELLRHLPPQDLPCGREQLLDLLSSLRIPRGSSPSTSPTRASSPSSSDADSDTASPPPRQPLPHIGALLRTGSTPWVVEIREPYTRVWSFDIAAIVAHLPLAPSLIVNYTITIPPGPPRPLSKAQHLARQLAAAVHQGSADRRFRVYVEGLQHWEELVQNSILGAGEFEDAHGFLVEGPTDLRREIARAQRAVERINAH